ncbi:MAG: hypothetical protein ACR2LY_07040 [Thermoleophilaceae bacterium]
MPSARALLMALMIAAALVAGCGGDEPAVTPGQTEEAEPAPSPEDTEDGPAEGGEEEQEE